MIPYETVRAHLERHHRIRTTDLTWEAMAAIHEHEHRAGRRHQAPLPLVVATPAEQER